MWYVAVQNIWGVAGHIQYYAKEREKTEQYISASPFELALEELTDEQFQQAKQKDGYID